MWRLCYNKSIMPTARPALKAQIAQLAADSKSVMPYLLPMPWYVSFPLNVVLFGAFWTLLAGSSPPKHPGMDWGRVFLAGGIGGLIGIVLLPINYLYHTRISRRG